MSELSTITMDARKLARKMIGHIPDGPASDTIQGAMERISDEIGGKITLESLAKELNCSPRTLERWFERYTGFPVHQLIIECRLGLAKRLIEDTGIRIADIALTLGYPDAQSFSRAVKSRFGSAPTVLRSLHKKA